MGKNYIKPIKPENTIQIKMTTLQSLNGRSIAIHYIFCLFIFVKISESTSPKSLLAILTQPQTSQYLHHKTQTKRHSSKNVHLLIRKLQLFLANIKYWKQSEYFEYFVRQHFLSADPQLLFLSLYRHLGTMYIWQK